VWEEEVEELRREGERSSSEKGERRTAMAQQLEEGEKLGRDKENGRKKRELGRGRSNAIEIL
jgi:hypothetical protein